MGACLPSVAPTGMGPAGQDATDAGSFVLPELACVEKNTPP